MTGVKMSSVNISSMCIASDIVIAEYNQEELSKLEAQKRLVRLLGRLSLNASRKSSSISPREI